MRYQSRTAPEQEVPTESEHAELYRLLVENTTDIITRVNSDYHRIYVSPACTEVLGYLQAELLGGHAFALVHPDDRPAVEEAFARIGPGSERADCVFRMRRSDGTYLWIEGRYRYQHSDGGILGVLRDISHRKQAEALLAEANTRVAASNALLAATLEHLSQGVCYFHGDQRLIIANRRYAEIYNLPNEMIRPGTLLPDIVARRYDVGTAPDMLFDAYMAWRNEVHRRGLPEETTLVLRSGRVIVIRHHPMPNGAWVGTHEDITERRRTEDMLHQAQKLEAVGRLTGGIAHDFNNMLQTVGTALEIAAGEQDPSFRAERAQLIDDARLAIDSAAQLTQQLLTFSRRQRLVSIRVDIGEAIAGMSGLLRQACGDRIAFALATPAEPLPCLVDISQFRSALLNLAINARDAMPDGGTLTIAVCPAVLRAGEIAGLPEGRFIRIAVGDTGHGIPPSDLARVFEPFFTTKGFGQGSGLGLAQVHGFAHQSGGSVLIASALGAGTTVTLLLPRLAAHPADQPA